MQNKSILDIIYADDKHKMKRQHKTVTKIYICIFFHFNFEIHFSIFNLHYSVFYNTLYEKLNTKEKAGHCYIVNF